MGIATRYRSQGRSHYRHRYQLHPQFHHFARQNTSHTPNAVYPPQTGSSICCILVLGPTEFDLALIWELQPQGYLLVTCNSVPPDLVATKDLVIEDRSYLGLFVAHSAYPTLDDSPLQFHHPLNSDKAGFGSAVLRFDLAHHPRLDVRHQTCFLHRHFVCIGF